ncbi:MAG TPA: hypothetical protein VMT64_05010, partial [Candidatus Binataceae bacterium]|nr:hypothetical protein [Candidatus Binataceae bacterium]
MKAENPHQESATAPARFGRRRSDGIPRRIAYVLKYFPKFSETFVASELAELRRREVEIRVLAIREPKVALRHRFIEAAGLDRITIYGAESFDKVIEEFEPELLHAHFATDATTEARRLAH